MKFKWRGRCTSFGQEEAWTYKRNYKAELIDQDGDFYWAHISETSTGKSKNILTVGGFDQVIGADRAEEILKILARGQAFEPSDAEKSCREYEFNPENINYMEKTPYELSQEVV